MPVEEATGPSAGTGVSCLGVAGDSGASQAHVFLVDNNGTEYMKDPLTGLDPSQLLPDQLRTYDIIVSHLQRTLDGEHPSPLCMIIHGKGGTGKSKVIQR